MKTFIVQNREALPETVSAGETLEGVQICPFGDWENAGVNQHCDREALQGLADAFDGEVLVDFEHNAESGGPTTAAAWIEKIYVDDERGLLGDFKFTDVGAEAVSSRRLRFLSPCWEYDPKSMRPTKLVSVALTNKPAIPVECVLNRASVPAVTNVEETKGPEMDKIKELLGLPPEASDEDVLSAVKDLQEKVALANKEKEEAEADAFAEEHKDVCNRDALKGAFLLNREAAQALVAGLAPRAPEQTVLENREVPAPKLKNTAASGLAACKSAEERISWLYAHKGENL